MKLMVKEKLESLLQTHWASFLDKSQLIRFVLETARDTEYKAIKQQTIPPKQIKLSITKFNIKEKGFEIWIEFTVPKDNGVVIGTHILALNLTGEFHLTDSYGTYLVAIDS